MAMLLPLLTLTPLAPFIGHKNNTYAALCIPSPVWKADIGYRGSIENRLSGSVYVTSVEG